MPCDVAMKWPDPWIVLFVLYDDVCGDSFIVSVRCRSSIVHRLFHVPRIPPIGVRQVAETTMAVPFAKAFGQNPKIVAMKMHGVRG